MIKKNRFKLAAGSLALLLSFGLTFGYISKAFAAPTSSVEEKAKKVEKQARVESSLEPDLKISKDQLPTLLKSLNVSIPTPEPGLRTLSPQPMSLETMSIQAAPTLGNNLILNPSLETTGTGGVPADWLRGGYGQNTRLLSYPVPGSSGNAIEADISAYTSGDAKWYFKDVPVTPGQQYQFSDYYKSDTTSYLTVRYKMSNGSFVYLDLTTLGPSATFKQATASFTIPANVVSLTIFHLIKSTGTLVTDEYSLQAADQSPPDANNLVLNPGFEQVGTNGLPTNWAKGRWGTNTTSFTYPDTTGSTGASAGVNITQYTSGDAKWYFNPISVKPGETYTYADQYSSNLTSYLTVQYQLAGGGYSYQDIATLPPTSGWKTSQANLIVPANAVSLTVFHLIKGVGSLKIDNVSLVKGSGSGTGNIFDTGAVTISLDDASISQLQNAVPVLDQSGLKATFYVATRQLSDYGFPGYMSKAQVKSLASKGHDIGSHTQTHAHLPNLSYSGQQAEISGSKQDLLDLGITPKTFAYPFGEFNADTLQIVSQNFQSARATITGYVAPEDNKYLLSRQSVESSTSFAQIKGWIDAAIANKQWLVLSIHRVDNSGLQYSTTPAIFSQIVNYLKSQNIRVVTVSEGVNDMNP